MKAVLPLQIVQEDGHVWIQCTVDHDCRKKLRLCNGSDVLNGQAIVEMVAHTKEPMRV